MAARHLDNEYRRRWELFFLEDGKVQDSRKVNWRDIKWDKVVKIEVHLEGQIHTFDNDQPGFKGFMNFRWGGKEAQLDADGKYTGHKEVNLWTVGWTDGQTCFLTDMDFFSGAKVKDYQLPIAELTGHVHLALGLEV